MSKTSKSKPTSRTAAAVKGSYTRSAKMGVLVAVMNLQSLLEDADYTIEDLVEAEPEDGGRELLAGCEDALGIGESVGRIRANALLAFPGRHLHDLAEIAEAIKPYRERLVRAEAKAEARYQAKRDAKVNQANEKLEAQGKFLEAVGVKDGLKRARQLARATTLSAQA